MQVSSSNSFCLIASICTVQAKVFRVQFKLNKNTCVFLPYIFEFSQFAAECAHWLYVSWTVSVWIHEKLNILKHKAFFNTTCSNELQHFPIKLQEQYGTTPTLSNKTLMQNVSRHSLLCHDAWAWSTLEVVLFSTRAWRDIHFTCIEYTVAYIKSTM